MAYPYRDNNWSANRSYVNLFRAGTHEYAYDVGAYYGVDGVVTISREPPSGRPKSYNCKGHTRIETVKNGRVYSRSFSVEISKRGLHRICRDFLADIGGHT